MLITIFQGYVYDRVFWESMDLKKRITVAKVAGTYVGTVVGAGFCIRSGNTSSSLLYWRKGLWGLLTVTFLFILFGYIAMELGIYILKADNHLRLSERQSGRMVGAFSDIIITFFLFEALTAMITQDQERSLRRNLSFIPL